jgi:hypothetical protein
MEPQTAKNIKKDAFSFFPNYKSERVVYSPSVINYFYTPKLMLSKHPGFQGNLLHKKTKSHNTRTLLIKAFNESMQNRFSKGVVHKKIQELQENAYLLYDNVPLSPKSPNRAFMFKTVFKGHKILGASNKTRFSKYASKNSMVSLHVNKSILNNKCASNKPQLLTNKENSITKMFHRKCSAHISSTDLYAIRQKSFEEEELCPWE